MERPKVCNHFGFGCHQIREEASISLVFTHSCGKLNMTSSNLNPALAEKSRFSACLSKVIRLVEITFLTYLPKKMSGLPNSKPPLNAEVYWH